MKRALRIGAVCVAGLIVALLAVYFLFPGAVLGAATQAARWSAGLSRAEVQVDDHRWVYLEGGKGEVVLFVHGFGENKDMWYNFPAAFSRKYRVVVPDLPGFGESSKLQEKNYSIPEQAARLERFTKAIGLTRFHLVGSSMGGGIAGYYASEHPEKVATLTLIGAFGVVADKKSEAMRMRDNDPKVTLAVWKPEDFDRNMHLAYDKPPQMPAHIRNYLMPVFIGQAEFNTKVFEDMWAGGLSILENRLARITSPTLVIWGKNDRIFDVSSAEKFKRGIGNSRVVVMDAGHVVQNDQPEKAAEACLAFIKAPGAP
jgi:abhydrolase domain-containing protein 6